MKEYQTNKQKRFEISDLFRLSNLYSVETLLLINDKNKK